MTIQWVLYKPGGPARYLLILKLGNRDGKTCLLECSRVPSHEVELLRRHKNALAGVSLDRKLEWLKEYCPIAVRHAYRTIPTDRLEVLQEY